MKFKDAYIKMLEGKRIKRPCMDGYWFIDGVSGNVTIHMADGTEVISGDLSLTLTNVVAEDWQVDTRVK